MPRPIVAKPFSRQPTYPAKIDPSHPIGRKVTAAIAAHYGASIRINEMISGLPSTVGAGAINFDVAGAVGKGFRPNSTSSGVYWSPPSVVPFCDGSKDFSVEILITFMASDAQFSRLLDCGGSGAGGGPTGGWDFETDSAGTGLNFVAWNGGTPATITACASMVAGRTYHVVVTQQVGGLAPTIYVNTKNIGNVTIGTITAANTAKFYYSTYRTAGDLSTAGVALHFARMYQGTILTPNEVKRLYEKPFEMFRRPRRIFANTVAGGDVTVALTGVSATGSVGNVGVKFDIAATGVSGTGSAGNVTPTQGLTGVSATGAAGNVGVAFDVPLTGTSATGAAGNIATGQTPTGVSGTGSVGNVGVNVTIGLTGVGATGAAGTVIYSGTGDITLALSGVGATGQVGTIATTGGDGGIDTHDPGLRKRLRKREERRQQEFAAERAKREARTQQVKAAFARVIEGAPEVSEDVAEAVVAAIEERRPEVVTETDFSELLASVQRVQRLWDEFIERDDEEVILLL